MHRMMFLAGITALLTSPAVAQQQPTEFEAWHGALSVAPQAAGAPPSTAATRVASPRRDHRYEGLLIGGVVLGTLGAWAGASLGSGDCFTEAGGGCGKRDRVGSAVIVGAIGAVVGGGLGYVIGRWGGGRPRQAARDSTAS